jgi:hypothetical protein
MNLPTVADVGAEAMHDLLLRRTSRVLPKGWMHGLGQSQAQSAVHTLPHATAGRVVAQSLRGDPPVAQGGANGPGRRSNPRPAPARAGSNRPRARVVERETGSESNMRTEEAIKLLKATHRAEFHRGLLIGTLTAASFLAALFFTFGCFSEPPLVAHGSGSGGGGAGDESGSTGDLDESGDDGAAAGSVSGGGSTGADESSSGDESTGRGDESSTGGGSDGWHYGVCHVDCEIPCMVAAEDETIRVCAPSCDGGCPNDGICLSDVVEGAVPVCFLPCPCPGGMECFATDYGISACMWNW